MSIGETVLVVVAGLALRLLIALAGLTIIVVPILGVFALLRTGGALRLRLRGFARAGTLLMKWGVYYAPGHTWLGEDAPGAVRVGLDDLAGRLLGGARSIRLVEPGRIVRRGDPLAEVRLASRSARIPAPVDGTIVGVNDALQESPYLVAADPYLTGWLALLSPADTGYRRFPRGAGARRWLEGEDRRLATFYEVKLGAAAADGGDFVCQPADLLGQKDWEELTIQFLGEGAQSA